MRVHRKQLILKGSSENVTRIDVKLMINDKCAEEIDKHYADATLIYSYEFVAVGGD